MLSKTITVTPNGIIHLSPDISGDIYTKNLSKIKEAKQQALLKGEVQVVKVK